MIADLVVYRLKQLRDALPSRSCVIDKPPVIAYTSSALRPQTAITSSSAATAMGIGTAACFLSATHFFVALACVPDLLKFAKHLFFATTLVGGQLDRAPGLRPERNALAKLPPAGGVP
jgi:hypothetical protein